MFRRMTLAFAAIAMMTLSGSAYAVCTNAPIAHDDAYNMSAGTTPGSYCGIGPGGVCYQPPAGFTGIVTIPYEVTDGCTTVGGDVIILVQ